MKLCWLLAVVLFSAGSISAQDGWRVVYLDANARYSGEWEGSVVDGTAVRGPKAAVAKVVIYGTKKSRHLYLGIWVDGLETMIDKRALWPFEGPSPGPESFNVQMLKIRLIRGKSTLQYNASLAVGDDINVPAGIAGSGDAVFYSVGKMDRRYLTFVNDMAKGFERGEITIGDGVFKPPIVVTFTGKNADRVIPLFLQKYEHLTAGSDKREKRGQPESLSE